ncbi:MAG: KpsF/GutQ family sugar-phosphate isomerase [Betaproteobacteria bacterium]|nr:KpsF/GutQ family sugar-phosphate isomerase [Pseudomonadota bacterium]NCX22738.1 KpsF/GutQ family sugar-phosphate isomerase [Betaproteobacteria bacterium]NDB97584.1 KpsF/GutQ family sugar-phosphate isomerase [Betaproteobacteria bacterium]
MPKPALDPMRLIASAREAIAIQAQALEQLAAAFDSEATSPQSKAFSEACERMYRCKGKVIVTGIGKSGHVANKIAATLASTGTPSCFLHPAEASHGDLGMVTAEDVVLALSNSGQTEEIVRILPLIRRRGATLIAITGEPQSLLAQQADVHLLVRVDREACPLNLAPTASTTAAMVMGDAIAVSLLAARGFSAEQFALSHPAGALGRKLLSLVGELMRTGEAIPAVRLDSDTKAAVLEMTKKRLGMTAVVDQQHRAVGIFTDGDLRRALERGSDFLSQPIADSMHPDPACIGPQALASEAARLMESRRITQVLVTDTEGVLIGALNIHDLLQAGVV